MLFTLYSSIFYLFHNYFFPRNLTTTGTAAIVNGILTGAVALWII
jgi:hypothetical protein